MTIENILLIVVIIAGLYVLAQIRVVRDTERIAVVSRGRFHGLRGPGLILAVRGPGISHHRVAYRAKGVIRSRDTVDVNGAELPYEALDTLAPGTPVRVVGFAPYRVHVEPDG